MTTENLVDQHERSEPDDEGCEYCGCGLYPHTISEEDADEGFPISSDHNIGDQILWCNNEDCENWHQPVGGFSA